MRTILKSSLFVIGLLLTSIVHAQEKTITGTITDESGESLPGAYVEVKGTQISAETDMDGNYEIQAKPGDTLIFSFIGLPDVEKTVGESNSMSVQFTENDNQIDQVVVTALGISRDKKSLGYATQEVSGEDVSTVKTGNVANSLSGKVAGIQVKRNNNMGGSTNVIIRGSTSLTGNNQALWVVDGIPIDNSNTNTARQQAGGKGFDYGNAAADINPDDIESINVLKGAAATALYGARAANGAIIVTTKKGSSKGRIGITINSGVTVGSIDRTTFPKYQKQYGGGYGPYYSDGSNPYLEQRDVNGDGVLDFVVPTTEDASYGAAYDPNLLVYNWDAFDPESPNYMKATPWTAPENDPVDFFETPVTLTNSIALSGATDESHFRFSYTNFSQEGIMPNSKLDRNTVAFRAGHEFTEKLTLNASVNYIKTNGKGRNSTGYSDNIMSMFRQWWQTNVDIKDQKRAYFNTGRNVTWNYASVDPNSSSYLKPIYWDNPYWARYQNYQTDERNRWFGNVALTYDFNDWLSATGRVSVDTYSELQEERRAVGSVATPFGIYGNDEQSGYQKFERTFSEYNYDLMLNFDRDLSDSFNLKGLIGTNIRQTNVEETLNSTNGGLVVPGLYSLLNSVNDVPDPVEADETVEVNGIFASASLGYNDFLFLDATIRRDQSSTLPSNNNSYYYPSVATSFVFSKLIDKPWLSFGKLRLNYAEVGNDAPFGRISDTYRREGRFNNDGNIALFSVRDTKNNPNLKPERTKSWETGLEMSFFKRRLGFDLALYKTNTEDLITEVAVSNATGYTNFFKNVGEMENKGIELALNAVPIKSSNFSWNVGVNWAKNENEVVSLDDGVQNLQLGSFQGGVTINATVGQPYGVIQGTDYTYADGQRIVDASNGQYIPSTESDKIIGNVQPDWNMGISNKFNYKNFALGFLIDIQKGGDIFSLDQYYGLATGLYTETAFINDLGNPVRNTIANGGGFINPGVNVDANGNVTGQNTTRIRADRFGAQGYRRGLPNKAFVYDASYVKLREVTISYTLPDHILQNTFIRNMTFTAIGSNLWIIDKNLPHADPEAGLSSGNVQGWQSGVLPTTRDFGFNVKVQF
ncbi:tonB-dependent receptor SusC [Flavobacteriaceae bacterium UJ101]|nr:tonB-dependent receptor SusC [Flavobacteriaceae bacterium UJ101]